MGGKGLPLAKSALPWVARNASSCVHSALLVGLDSGKMMGRSFCSAIACMHGGRLHDRVQLTPCAGPC